MTLTADRVAAVLGDRSRVIQALDNAERLARRVVDPSLLDLCEQRVAELLRLEKPVDPGELSETQTACLAFAEHWVIDVATMPDGLVADVAGQLGDDGLMDFVHGLLVVEQRQRLKLAWQQLGVAP